MRYCEAMSDVYQQLGELLDVFVGGKTLPEGKNISVILQELDHIKDTCREELDPQMLHYLDRRSYEKAFAYLKNPQLPHRP